MTAATHEGLVVLAETVPPHVPPHGATHGPASLDPFDWHEEPPESVWNMYRSSGRRHNDDRYLAQVRQCGPVHPFNQRCPQHIADPRRCLPGGWRWIVVYGHDVERFQAGLDLHRFGRRWIQGDVADSGVSETRADAQDACQDAADEHHLGPEIAWWAYAQRAAAESETQAGA